MQLKRDTDYALRIMHCLKKLAAADGAEQSAALTLSEISALAVVPKLAAARICEALCARGIIRSRAAEEAGDQPCYFADRFTGRSLLDLVEATEDAARIFAVFDRKSPMYRDREKQLLRAQRRVERALADISLDRLAGAARRKKTPRE